MQEGTALAELRAIVGCLGEEHGWWDSQFFSRSARAFLEPIFPRSLSMSQYQGVTVAAGRAHDERIGVGRIVHLFRMPELHEQAATATLREAEGIDRAFACLGSQEQALERLDALATPVEPSDGPVLVGTLDTGLEPWLGKLAGHYASAIRDGRRAYPYLRHTV